MTKGSTTPSFDPNNLDMNLLQSQNNNRHLPSKYICIEYIYIYSNEIILGL